MELVETEINHAKKILDNGCFTHNSLVEEAIARTRFETLKRIKKKANKIIKK